MFFGNGINPKVINGLFILLILFSLASMTSEEWIAILITLPAVIISITFHEYAHAAMAVHFGDNTPKAEGRLTLNPIKHFEWFGFIMLMFTHIGWGKPVKVNSNSFTSNKPKAYCESMVALAGPMMNFLLAIVFEVIAVAISMFIKHTTVTFYLCNMCAVGSMMNIGMGIFNLIPIYPLDGEKIFRNFLPAKWKMAIQNNYATISFIFLFLWVVGILGRLVSPIINVVYSGLEFVVLKVFSIF